MVCALCASFMSYFIFDTLGYFAGWRLALIAPLLLMAAAAALVLFYYLNVNPHAAAEQSATGGPEPTTAHVQNTRTRGPARAEGNAAAIKSAEYESDIEMNAISKPNLKPPPLSQAAVYAEGRAVAGNVSNTSNPLHIFNRSKVSAKFSP